MVAKPRHRGSHAQEFDLNNNNGTKFHPVMDGGFDNTEGPNYKVANINTGSPTIVTLPPREAHGRGSRQQQRPAKDGSLLLQHGVFSLLLEKIQHRFGKLNLSLRTVVLVVKKLLRSDSWRVFFQVIIAVFYAGTLRNYLKTVGKTLYSFFLYKLFTVD